MIKQNQQFLNVLNVLGDSAIILISYIISIQIRFNYLPNFQISPINYWKPNILIMIAFYSLFVVFFYKHSGLYSALRFKSLFSEIIKVVWINFWGVIALSSVLFVVRLIDFSRLSLIFFYLTSTLLIITKKVILRFVLRIIRRRGFNLKHILLIGDGELARQYADVIKTNKYYGVNIVGYVSDKQSEHLLKIIWAGPFDQLDKIMNDPGIDEVVIALDLKHIEKMEYIIQKCEKHGLKASIIPFYNNIISTEPSIEIIGNSRLLHLRTYPLDLLSNKIQKRVFDLIISTILIVMTMPIILVSVVGILLTSPGPIIFKQARIGLNRKPFNMYKLRTMRVNSEHQTAWSKDNDIRKTFWGSILRKFSIDELPQLFNVLVGSMSLIGPRPEIEFHVNHFKEEIPHYMKKHHVKPGITGWAQINGFRGDTSIEERIKHDLWYIENWTLGLDFKIMFLTIFKGLVNREEINYGY